MKFKNLISVSAFALVVSCTTAGVADPLIKELAAIGNAGQADLLRVSAIASVANPNLPGGIEDKDGLACAQAAMGVLAQIQAVNAAAAGGGAGVFTVAEMASLFQPGSPQYNQALNALGTGCLAKANDVLGPQGVVLAGGVVGAMVSTSQILPLLAAAQ